jgi:hypothetical protein
MAGGGRGAFATESASAADNSAKDYIAAQIAASDTELQYMVSIVIFNT